MSDDLSYQVNLTELDDIANRLKGFVGFLSDSLTGLEQRISSLHMTWTGPAATKHSDAFNKWLAGTADVSDGIEKMRQAAVAAHGRYISAIEANLNMLGRK
ncbi:WXG100 family type VII secretion target [Nocardia aurantiaca]|uniref:WXG100 family type VII secretion target n=1 Tax=Nocardia aurantiaca TaxID=2675850 RepID=A0A6I3KPQ0_9NOCA|nr:WXG100 family type VII secretion target [Nocardia aurantiaca]MTE12613.1 WXG100 family type VII secretion target [Nocardia aurantiaca]